MRHKYGTRSLVLSRASIGEANVRVALLTEDLGLVNARAQNLRSSGAKLAAALVTYAESDVVLVRGKEEWRIAGAVLEESWSARLPGAARLRAARVTELLQRLVVGELRDREIFTIITGYVRALASLPESLYDAAEILAMLRLLAVLGFGAGPLPGGSPWSEPQLVALSGDRARYIERINTGIKASGL